MNIFLTGYRCTGKTSVGKALADTLKLNFVDSDVYLVKQYQMTITDIVASGGWDSFREKERKVTKELCMLDKHVVATGGGVILDENNVKRMKKSGVILWLRATPETIKNRIVLDETTKDSRPSLTSKGLLEEIEGTLKKRNPLYEKAMDFAVDTDDVKTSDICNTIIEEIIYHAWKHFRNTI